MQVHLLTTRALLLIDCTASSWPFRRPHPQQQTLVSKSKVTFLIRLSHFYAEVNLASVYLQGSLIELFSVRSWRVMYAPFPLVITGCSKICRYRCKLNATASASLATERPMFRMYQS